MSINEMERIPGLTPYRKSAVALIGRNGMRKIRAVCSEKESVG